MDTDPWLWCLILQLILLALNAVFSAAEIAVLSLSEKDLSEKQEEGSGRVGTLLKYKQKQSRFIVTTKYLSDLMVMVAAAAAVPGFAEPTYAFFNGRGQSAVGILLILLIYLALLFLFMLFGDRLPRRLAKKDPMKTALALCGAVDFFSVIFTPTIALMDACFAGIQRAQNLEQLPEDRLISEDEIRRMVDAGTQKGTIDSDENEMIQNVFEFDDISADEICTHRKDVDILYMEDSMEEWKQVIHESRHSLYPVCDDTADNVIGVLDAKDYFRLGSDDRDEIMKKAVKRPYFVPGTIRADILFQNMKQRGNYFAVVLDEYGGMDGIITVRDLVEQLVGDLAEEDEEHTAEIFRISNNVWKVKGSAPLDDVADELGVKLPVDDYDTFGGYIFGQLGAIPVDGKKFDLTCDGMHIRVVDVRDHRVESTIVRLLPAQDENSSQNHAS